MNRKRIVFLVAAWAVAGSWAAGEKPYIVRVGELVGAAKSPEIMKEQCAARFRGSAKENEKLWKAWREQHATVLDAVDAQIKRADARLKRDAPDAKLPDSPSTSVTRAHLKRVFDAMNDADAKEYCAQFPAVLEQKDRDMHGEISSLLADVEAADREITARETAPAAKPAPKKP